MWDIAITACSTHCSAASLPDAGKSSPVDDYLRMRMVDGFRHFTTGELDAAIDTLDLVLKTCCDIPDTSLAAWAHFWKGRAHRKKGEYEASLKDIVQAREMAQADHDDMFTSVIQIQESWLLFQKGMSRDALQILDRAESVLKSTDHYVALGNIESARGRIIRRSGEYTKALEHFARAIEMYARQDSESRQSRTHPGECGVCQAPAGPATSKAHRYARSIRAASFPLFAKAARGHARKPAQPVPVRLAGGARRSNPGAEIYALHAHFDGIGKVVLNLGYLHLDRGDVERAWEEAIEAYRIGLEQNDHILMARARILQAAIENAHVEEQTGEDVDNAVHANRALQYSEEALSLAHGTQNRRLLAGACIARGMTAANDFFQEWETARRYATEATGLIGPGENDHLVEDLTQLKSRVVQASGINDTLRGWSEGIVGNKTFQQITEEFAEIVIPKVWIREDRKVSRVATSLSISPKKVRRILRNSGLVERQ